MCFVRQRNGGRIWTIGPNGATQSIGQLRGADAARVALGPGLRLTFAHATDRVTDVDAATGHATEIRLPAASGYLMEARTSARRLVVLRQDAASSRLTLYRVE